MWADRGSGSISFTIRTSRMGSVTALAASLSRSILFTIRARRMGSRVLCITTRHGVGGERREVGALAYARFLPYGFRFVKGRAMNRVSSSSVWLMGFLACVVCNRVTGGEQPQSALRQAPYEGVEASGEQIIAYWRFEGDATATRRFGSRT